MKQKGVAAGSRLPYVWMLVSSLSFAAMATLAHALGTSCDWPVIALARSLVPLAGVTVVALLCGAKLALWHPPLLWVWSVGAGLGMLGTFFALQRLPASDVLTLTNTYPVWVALLSWPLLGERPPWSLWPCVLAGVAGVVLVQQPHLAEQDPALLARQGGGRLVRTGQDRSFL